MNVTAILESNPTTDAEYEAAINIYLQEMARMKGEMDERQKHIEKLRAETESILATFPTGPLASKSLS